MPISFDTQTITIKELFSGDNVYRMPTFQRPYSWGVEQVLQLYDDLNTNFLNQSKNSDSDFFLGPIVVTENNSDAPTQVVDGQQRLVTITFILAFLRDYSGNDAFKKEINDYLWKHRTALWNHEDIPRVMLRDLDKEFMHNWVHSIGGTRNLPNKAETDSSQNLLSNIKALKEEIGVVNDNYVESFAKFILSNCYVIKIVSKDNFEAYRIFKSINTIGQPLTELDIIRGEILNPQYDSYGESRELSKIWDNIEQELGLDELEKYVLIVLSTIDREYVSQPLKNVFRKILADASQLNNFRIKLINFISYYDQLKSARLEFGNDSKTINDLVKCIRQAPTDHWYSVSLLWLARERTNRDAIAFFSALDALCIGLRILKITAKGKLNKRFSAIEVNIQNGDVLTSGSSALFLSKEEKHKIRLILEAPIKPTERYLKPLLLRINAEIQNNEIPKYFPESISLEHILPKNPNATSNWLKKFPNSQNRDRLCNLLGNFTILTQPTNAGIRNSEFQIKMAKIFKNEGAEVFALTSVLNGYNDWTEESILSRNKDLIDIARQIMQI